MAGMKRRLAALEASRGQRQSYVLRYPLGVDDPRAWAAEQMRQGALPERPVILAPDRGLSEDEWLARYGAAA